MAENDFEKLADAYEFGSTYPVVTTPSSPQAGASSAPESSLQRQVTQAIQGVLGRSFRQGDHRSFKAALEVSFEYREIEGRPSYEWKPRAYPAVGATDIGGGISGAQYTLVSFAAGMHRQARPLIDDLHSLVPGLDEENFEAVKAIFSTAFDEFVGELSREGGPRAPRANALALSIFDPNVGAGYLVQLGALLGMVVTSTNSKTGEVTTKTRNGRFSFVRDNVVTSVEEGHLTNFIAISGYYFAVADSWKLFFDNFFKEKKDLGGRLLDIERQLAVVEDGVGEVFVAMDSVNVDQSERLVTIVNFTDDEEGDTTNNLSVEDFLSWVASFASGEAPQLIREGGKLGVKAIAPTAQLLRNMTSQLIRKCEDIREMEGEESESGLPNQFGHLRVIDPLRELKRYLNALFVTANSDF